MISSCSPWGDHPKNGKWLATIVITHSWNKPRINHFSQNQGYCCSPLTLQGKNTSTLPDTLWKISETTVKLADVQGQTVNLPHGNSYRMIHQVIRSHGFSIGFFPSPVPSECVTRRTPRGRGFEKHLDESVEGKSNYANHGCSHEMLRIVAKSCSMKTMETL